MVAIEPPELKKVNRPGRQVQLTARQSAKKCKWPSQWAQDCRIIAPVAENGKSHH